MEEVWKEVIGWEGRYRISNHGNVYSYFTDDLMKCSDNGNGYAHLVFTKYLNGKRTSKGVYPHQLVAQHFLNNDAPDVLTEVNHKNLDKRCNIVTNLEWVSRIDNIAHAIKNGAIDTNGHKSKLSIFSEDQVASIRQRFMGIKKRGARKLVTEVATEFDCSVTTIYRIINNERYKITNDQDHFVDQIS